MIYYKDDATIFCKVICTHCGSDTELMHVNVSAIDENGRVLDEKREITEVEF
jgi:hypothetical protein